MKRLMYSGKVRAAANSLKFLSKLCGDRVWKRLSSGMCGRSRNADVFGRQIKALHAYSRPLIRERAWIETQPDARPLIRRCRRSLIRARTTAQNEPDHVMPCRRPIRKNYAKWLKSFLMYKHVDISHKAPILVDTFRRFDNGKNSKIDNSAVGQ